MKKSFSQSGEDLIIDFIFKAKSTKCSIYLDIGCNHPVQFNNTFLFYLDGANGCLIDANPELKDEYKRERPQDVFIGVPVSGNGEPVEFYEFETDTVNTCDSNIAKTYMENFKIKSVKKVESFSLANISSTYFNLKNLDLLSLDIEGGEIEILESFFKSGFESKVVCVETISYSKDLKGVKNQEILNLMLSNGYFIYADTYINTIFVKESFWKN